MGKLARKWNGEGVEGLVEASFHRKWESSIDRTFFPEITKTTASLGFYIYKTFVNDGKLIAFGNGGSCYDAAHFCAELTGKFNADRQPFPAICLNDAGFLTAVGNDYGFERVFSRGVSAFCQPQDFVLGISTSGKSNNVVNGLLTARQCLATPFLLTGKEGGPLCSGNLTVPHIKVDSQKTDEIQEAHMTILHTVVEVIEALHGDIDLYMRMLDLYEDKPLVTQLNPLKEV